MMCIFLNAKLPNAKVLSQTIKNMKKKMKKKMKRK